MVNDFIILLLTIIITSILCVIIYIRKKEIQTKRKELFAISLLSGFMCFFVYFFVRFIFFNLGVTLPSYMVIPITIVVFIPLYKIMSNELNVYNKNT